MWARVPPRSTYGSLRYTARWCMVLAQCSAADVWTDPEIAFLISNAQVASDYISCTRTLYLASLQEYLFLLGGRCFSLCLSRKGRFASIWNARVWWNGFMQSFWNSVSVSAWLICQVLAQGRRSVTVGCEYCEGSEKDAVSVQLFGQWTEVNHKFSSTSRPSTDHKLARWPRPQHDRPYTCQKRVHW